MDTRQLKGTADDIFEIISWVSSDTNCTVLTNEKGIMTGLRIHNPKGDVEAKENDYIIRTEEGYIVSSGTLN